MATVYFYCKYTISILAIVLVLTGQQEQEEKEGDARRGSKQPVVLFGRGEQGRNI